MNKKKKKRIERYKSYRDRIPLLSAAISTIMATECLIGSDIFKLASLILFEFCLFLVSWSLVISCWELFRECRAPMERVLSFPRLLLLLLLLFRPSTSSSLSDMWGMMPVSTLTIWGRVERVCFFFQFIPFQKDGKQLVSLPFFPFLSFLFP